MDKKNFVENALDLVEGNLATVAVRLGSWLAPIPTAFLIWRATMIHLGWPSWVSFVAGAVIELLGLGTVNLALTFRTHNATKRAKDPGAPFPIALALAGVYFGTVTLLTVILEVLPGAALVSPVVFIGMSLTGAGTLMLRNDHARRLAAIRDKKQEEKAGREARRAARSVSFNMAKSNTLETANAARQQQKQDALDAVLVFIGDNPGASLADIALHVGKGKSTVAGYVAELQTAGTIRRNGRGLEVV
ncbi:MAG: MarR family transcriptional regulator [Thermoflexales bacterium]|nr:MarR family transcriptional regulator [Thermoflexales bacterium]